MDYDEEDSRFHYKMQASHYRHSSESLHCGDRDRDDEERSCTPQEQFEPILSDDEIIGDDEEDDAEDAAAIAEYERELEAAAAAAPPAINAFEPWQKPLQFYEGSTKLQATQLCASTVLQQR
ncbi:protein virilizer-like [Drosophila ananassae]|uniref:protein virilizer-like n=1 Tax=Drosophila ananassae TaxID=7217 RepID=UPI0013A5ECD7|nr:protein virilizer-like [Drosophila ananassae]